MKLKEILNRAIQSKSICLSLNNCNLTKIPDEIQFMETLGSLDLSNNNITTVPDFLTNLPRLKILNLSNNKIQSLPDFSPRTLITKLDLSNNQFTEVPRQVPLA